MFPMDFAVSVLIDSMGEEVDVLKRTETTDDNGDVTFTYPRTISTRAFIREVSGYAQFWELPGYTENVDMAGIFYHNADVNIGDLVKKENGDEFEVNEIVERTSGKDVDFKEVLMIKIH